MSIQQLEQTVRNLSAEELAKFAEWFDTYRTTFEPADADDGELSAGQRAELDRRLDALDADPSLAVPWEGTKESVIKALDELLAAKARHR